MKTNSPPDEVIELRCPRCVGAGKRGLLGRLVKRRLDVVVQGALRLGSPEMLADVVLYCDNCKIDVVYMLAVLPGASAATVP